MKSLLERSVLWLSALSLAAGALACDAAGPEVGSTTRAVGPQAQVEIAIAPLQLTDVTNALYSVTVQNSAGAVIVGATISSQFYGDGAGSAVYVAPCDADPAAQPNRVTVTLLQLFSDTAPVAVEALPQLTREVVCEPNTDTLVEFDITVVRSAEQGFFDIKVTYADIFCSAKLDCVEGFADTNLTTAVLGFACTAGEGLAQTSLYMSDVLISCNIEGISINPDADGYVPGAQIVYSPGLWPGMVQSAAVYRGDEGFTEVDQLYWNLAIGLADAGDNQSCRLRARATATEVPLVGPPYLLDEGYPFVDFDVALTDGTGTPICDGDPLGGSASGVTVMHSTTANYEPALVLRHEFGGP